MATDFTTVENVKSLWIGGNLPDDPIITAYIQAASVKIRFEFPDIDTRIDGETTDDPPVKVDGWISSDQAAYVENQVVIRALRNPDNARQETVTSYSMTYAGETPGGITLTDEDKAMLSGVLGAGANQAFSIDLLSEQELDDSQLIGSINDPNRGVFFPENHGYIGVGSTRTRSWGHNGMGDAW